MGVHDVDVVALQALERLLGARADVVGGEPALAAELRRDDDVVASPRFASHAPITRSDSPPSWPGTQRE